jgi:hypothetical protein
MARSRLIDADEHCWRIGRNGTHSRCQEAAPTTIVVHGSDYAYSGSKPTHCIFEATLIEHSISPSLPSTTQRQRDSAERSMKKARPNVRQCYDVEWFCSTEW